MKSIFRYCWILALAALSSISSPALSGVEVIANNDVPGTEISLATLKGFFTGKAMYWDGGAQVVIVTLADKTDSAIEEVSGMNASAFKTHWQRLAFSGRGQQPKKVDDAARLVALVASTKGAIALVPAGTEAAGVKKLAVK